MAGFGAWRTGRTKGSGPGPSPTGLVAPAFVAAGLAGAPSGALGWLLMYRMTVPAWLPALVVIPLFGALYLGITHLMKIDEASGFLRRLTRRGR